MTRIVCEAATCPRTAIAAPENIWLCAKHIDRLKDRHAVTLKDRRQLRVAVDCEGNNPSLVIARLGFDELEDEERKTA